MLIHDRGGYVPLKVTSLQGQVASSFEQWHRQGRTLLPSHSNWQRQLEA